MYVLDYAARIICNLHRPDVWLSRCEVRQYVLRMSTSVTSLIGIVHTGQLAKDVARMSELVPEANLPGRASQVTLSLLQLKSVP